MSDWTKQAPLKSKPNPCANCPPIVAVAPLDKIIAVGFGSAVVLCDGKVMLDGEDMSREDFASFADAERLAAADPDHDWRVELYGPLHGETYQRHGDAQWVLVKTNEGFA